MLPANSQRKKSGGDPARRFCPTTLQTISETISRLRSQEFKGYMCHYAFVS